MAIETEPLRSRSAGSRRGRLAAEDPPGIQVRGPGQRASDAKLAGMNMLDDLLFSFLPAPERTDGLIAPDVEIPLAIFPQEDSF
jgi:hypothetical protein